MCRKLGQQGVRCGPQHPSGVAAVPPPVCQQLAQVKKGAPVEQQLADAAASGKDVLVGRGVGLGWGWGVGGVSRVGAAGSCPRSNRERPPNSSSPMQQLTARMSQFVQARRGGCNQRGVGGWELGDLGIGDL